MDKTVEVIALYASATQNAFVILTKCLMDNGALEPGQFSSAIKAILNEAEVDRQRPDYHHLQVLSTMLDALEAQRYSFSLLSSQIDGAAIGIG